MVEQYFRNTGWKDGPYNRPSSKIRSYTKEGFTIIYDDNRNAVVIISKIGNLLIDRMKNPIETIEDFKAQINILGGNTDESTDLSYI